MHEEVSTFSLQNSNFYCRPTGAIFDSTSRKSRSSWFRETSLNLKASDILARARDAIGVSGEGNHSDNDDVDDDENDTIKIFSDDLLEDMQQALLTLEKRVKGGPSSLSVGELHMLQERLDRVIVEMRDFMLNGNEFAETVKGADGGFCGWVLKSTSEIDLESTRPQISSGETVLPSNTAATVEAYRSSDAQPSSPKLEYEHNPEEGPAYDGKGGLGLAKGTTNTYAIDGMEGMTPEEYREELQKSISARSKKRRETGNVGNQNSNNYLNNL